MISITIEDLDPNQAMELVRELRDQGLTQGTDFDFSYNKTSWDPISGHQIKPKHTVFTFYDDKQATFFALKYS